jgi:hypothetical protein
VAARLGDTHDPVLPIYRNATLVSVVVDGASGAIRVWEDANPATTAPSREWNLATFFPAAPTRLRIVDGYLVTTAGDKTWVGLNTSSLLSKALPMFAPAGNISTMGALVNSSVLRYLELEGTYIGDVPFVLPSLMVLDMRHASAVLQAAATSPGPALVLATGKYSAILGGRFDCSTASNITGKEFTGISVDGVGITVRGATVTNCGFGNGYMSGNIRVRGHGSEVAHCEVAGGARGIWTETITSSVVHDNSIQHTAVGIDVDGGSGPHVSVYNNLIQHSTGYGLWFEEGSQGISAFNNTIRNNTVGIYLYNNGVKDRTLSQLMVVGNTVTESRHEPLGFGSHNGQAARTQQNLFASNVFKNNSGQIFDQGGAVDFWFMSNSFDQPTALAAGRIEGTNAADVSLLDP